MDSHINGEGTLYSFITSRFGLFVDKWCVQKYHSFVVRILNVKLSEPQPVIHDIFLTDNVFIIWPRRAV